MSTHHITSQQLALYVMDGLDAAAREPLEQHIAGCPRCAAALADEARFEQLLHELPLPQPAAEIAAPSVALPQPFSDAEPWPIRAQMRRRFASRSLWVLAAAATLVFWLKLSPSSGPSPIRRPAPEPSERLDRLSIAEQSLLSVPPSPELLACNLDSSRQCAWGPAPGAVIGPVSLVSMSLPEVELDSKPDEGDSMCDVPEAVTCSGHEQVCSQ